MMEQAASKAARDENERSCAELKLMAPTYYGGAHARGRCRDNEEFDEPHIPILLREAEGVRIVLGTHDYDDMEKPDIQIERRPNGWAIFLHPIGGGDPSGYVYFFDDGRSFLMKEAWHGEPGAIRVVRQSREVQSIDIPIESQPTIVVQLGNK